MLRSPLVSLTGRPVVSTAVILGLAAWLWAVAAAASTCIQASTAMDGWLERFVPVVYLEPGLDEESVGQLHSEIEQWPGSDRVEFRSSAEMLAQFEGGAEADEIDALGIDESMMPAALVVSVDNWRGDGAEIVERIDALSQREMVVGTDTPDSRMLRWVGSGRIVAGALAVLIALGLSGTLVAAASFLRRLQRDDWRENHLLEVFGASPSSLNTATVARASALGLAAGVVAGVAFLPWSITVDGMVAEVAGRSAMPAFRSAMWAAGLAVSGLVIGGVLGWLCRRPAGPDGRSDNDSLLYWERRG